MKTLILWLDAVRQDYVFSMPYLQSLAQRWGICPLVPPFGYLSIASSFFTGVGPKKHQRFTVYGRNARCRPIGDTYFRFFPSKIGFHAFNLWRAVRGNDFALPSVDWTQARNVCACQERYFHHPNALPVPTLFDFLRQQGLSFAVFQWPFLYSNDRTRLLPSFHNSDRERVRQFVRLLRSNEADLWLVHLWDVDTVAHTEGPNPSQISRVLEEQDQLIKEILSHFDLESDAVFIWSDHGMLPVTTTLNLNERLPPPVPGEYRFFDSTLGRFWFEEPADRERMAAQLDAVEGGRVLSNTALEALGIPSNCRFYGDIIFLADRGNLIFPNAFQVTRPVKGMHGYDVTDPREWGIFLTNRARGDAPVRTVDVLPTILASLNVEVDASFDGVPITAG